MPFGIRTRYHGIDHAICEIAGSICALPLDQAKEGGWTILQEIRKNRGTPLLAHDESIDVAIIIHRENRAAWDAGQRAFIDGRSEDANPHLPGSLHRMWRLGWHDAWKNGG